MRVEPVVDCACHLREGPVWYPTGKRLYWLGIRRGRVLVYDPAANYFTGIYEGEKVGGTTVQAESSLLLLMSKGRIASWRRGQLSLLARIDDP